MTAAHDTQALVGFLTLWAHESRLQTFENRERFRKEATALASRLQEQEGQPALSDELATAIHRMPYVRDCLLAYHGRPADPEAVDLVKAIAAQLGHLAAGSQAVQVPADKSQAARYEIGKWLNEGQLREINRQALAELCAGFDQLERAVQVPGWRPIETAPKDGTRVILSWGGKSINGFYLDNSATATPWQGWRVESMVLRPEGQPMAWMPFPSVLGAPLQPLAGGEVT